MYRQTDRQKTVGLKIKIKFTKNSIFLYLIKDMLIKHLGIFIYGYAINVNNLNEFDLLVIFFIPFEVIKLKKKN